MQKTWGKPTYFFYLAEKASETSFRQYQDTSAMYYRSLSLLIYKLKWYHNPNNADGWYWLRQMPLIPHTELSHVFCLFAGADFSPSVCLVSGTSRNICACVGSCGLAVQFIWAFRVDTKQKWRPWYLRRAIMRRRKRTEEDEEMNLGRERDEEVSESEEKERSQGGRAGKCKW